MKATLYFNCLLVLLIGFLLADEEIKVNLKPDMTLMIPMRDGVKLPTDLYLPYPEAKGLPCILLRSPEGRRSQWTDFAQIAKLGYVIAIQDTRHSLTSETSTSLFLGDGWGKMQDGYDAVEWLANSPYTNGKIGTWGISALGTTQLLMAPSNPPHLHCQYIIAAEAALYSNGLYPAKRLLQKQKEKWPVSYMQDRHALFYPSRYVAYIDTQKQSNLLAVTDRVHVPAIYIDGWYNKFLPGTLAAFLSRQNEGGKGARGKQKLIIGPWSHFWPLVPGFENNEATNIDLNPPENISAERWFGHYLKDEANGVEKLPPIIYYVMGPLDGSPSTGNSWRTATTWPPVSTKTTSLYLTPHKGLQKEVPFEGMLSYIYNPLNPIPLSEGDNLFSEVGPRNQQKIEDREDILSFTSNPLKKDLEITGNVIAKIFFASNQEDIDLVVRLCDVYPDGKSILIAEGLYQLGAIHYQAQPTISLAAGIFREAIISLKRIKPIDIMIDLGITSMVFATGHSIRLSVTNANYYPYKKKLSAGQIPRTGRNQFNIAKNMIFMGGMYSSQILLPIAQKEKKMGEK